MRLNVWALSLALWLACSQPSLQDVYMHNMRGSNNRLNEKSATRTNNNRVFDSQNNARGGYNVGDATSQPFQTEDGQYQMKYIQSGVKGNSYLTIEWTDQHGCGGSQDSDPTKQNCAIVLQYMCMPNTGTNADPTNLDRIRDGLNTQSQDYTNMADDTQAANSQRKTGDVKTDRVIQETWDYYDACNYRERNSGLFTADQNLGKNNKGYSSAVFTRQNPNGQRSGYECPEERDYYPYWHPTPWKDAAVLTNNVSLCDQLYLKENFNTKSKWMCVENYAGTNVQKHWSRWNNQDSCQTNGGTWTEFWNYLEKAPQYTDQASCESNKGDNMQYKWAVPYGSTNVNKKECLVLLGAPVCQQASWTRSNHLGNTRAGTPANFTWTLPYFPSKSIQKCVFRIRYNITTEDYDPFGTDSNSNNQNSPVKNNPQVNIGVNNQVLQLAINTAQYGRVFQDRSHSFFLMPRTSTIADTVNIYNLNVRGKRGNIVQVYPGVEYDFIPNQLVVTTNDYVHVQWTGSNTHNNGAPGGDGQTGDAGQGQTGTDRSNLVQVNGLNENFPLPFEMTSLWKEADLIAFVNNVANDSASYLTPKSSFKTTDLAKDLALYFSASSYYQCVKTSTCSQSYEALANNPVNADLNNSPASVPGALLRFGKSGALYYYISSRNNNFSNRSQKGQIKVA